MPAYSFETENWLNPEAEEFTSVIIKNSSGADVCSKCRKKLVNGTLCATRKNSWHWVCSGILEYVCVCRFSCIHTVF